MALEKELATFGARLPELLQHEGKFVLIHEDQVVGTYVAYEDAINEGYKTFGLEPFLVKRIQAAEQVHFVSRISSCPISAVQ